LNTILNFIEETYPMLTPVVKWNQPMFTHHGTYIIGFSKAKKHLNLAPEEPVITKFENALKANQYKRTKMLIQIQDHQSVDLSLLKSMIDFIIEDKIDVNTFWR